MLYNQFIEGYLPKKVKILQLPELKLKNEKRRLIPEQAAERDAEN